MATSASSGDFATARSETKAGEDLFDGDGEAADAILRELEAKDERPCAQGDFWYHNLSGGPAHFVFSAQDFGATGDKGSVVVSDAIWGLLHRQRHQRAGAPDHSDHEVGHVHRDPRVESLSSGSSHHVALPTP